MLALTRIWQPNARARALVAVCLILMAKHQYFSFETTEDHLSDGVNDAWVVTAQSIARANSDISPYLLPNEYICGTIGVFLGLTIPPFAIMRKSRRSKPMFASLHFGRGDAAPNDAIPERCWGSDPKTCTGIMLFDILVANSDRHSGNIKVDNPIEPKQIRVFDHDRALLGIEQNDGHRQVFRRLKELKNRLGISKGSKSGGNECCFLPVANTSQYFAHWLNRINQIPDWFIDDTCKSAVGLGITSRVANAAAEFLKYRKANEGSIIDRHRDCFPNIRDWGLIT
ncbi:MAG: hypothetical protein ACJ8C4_02490 [Gemmataceae bacterium]